MKKEIIEDKERKIKMHEWTTTKSRKAKLTKYFNGKEFVEKEVSCFFHGFFQHQDGNESCAIAIIELEDGSVQTVDPDNIIFEKEN